LNELKLVEVKIGDNSEPCLMTCYLDYDKMGKLETLSGTYTSRNTKDKGDCGSGKVYLEKTTTSDFRKEDFLVRRENEKKRFNPLVKKADPKPPVNTFRTPVPSTSRSNPPVTNTTPKVKPGAERNVITKVENPIIRTPDVPVAQQKREEPKREIVLERKLPPTPDVIRKRNNELVKTFSTAAKTIRIELYDNGEIDGDTITVYHNNRLIISKKRLTDKPLSFTIEVDEDDAHHEFVMVAENLGSIPPNTALMVVTAGSRRYETFLTSTEKKNAMVIIEYKHGGTP
jgi:hypothetical protein